MSDDVLIALFGPLGTVLVAYLGYLGIRVGIKHQRKKRADGAGEEEDLEAEAIAQFENNPQEFFQNVLKDNATKAKDLDDLRKQVNQLWSRLSEQEEETRQLRRELETQQRDETRFRDAIGRWLNTLFAAWGKTDVMPWPGAADAEILKGVLPERAVE